MKCCSCGSTEPKPAAEEDEEESIPARSREPRRTPQQLPDLHVSPRRNRNYNPPPPGPPRERNAPARGSARGPSRPPPTSGVRPGVSLPSCRPWAPRRHTACALRSQVSRPSPAALSRRYSKQKRKKKKLEKEVTSDHGAPPIPASKLARAFPLPCWCSAGLLARQGL